VPNLLRLSSALWSESSCVLLPVRAPYYILRISRKYGFQGVDLDWEYPGDPKRGGRKLADTRNLPMLVREMRAAYGDRYGISVTLAPDYWYLRWFDAKAIEPNVDFFGFMAYGMDAASDEFGFAARLIHVPVQIFMAPGIVM
jgi:GH18 family chitinase